MAEEEKLKSIGLNQVNHKKLFQLKLDKNFKSMDEVIEHLLKAPDKLKEIADELNEFEKELIKYLTEGGCVCGGNLSFNGKEIICSNGCERDCELTKSYVKLKEILLGKK